MRAYTTQGQHAASFVMCGRCLASHLCERTVPSILGLFCTVSVEFRPFLAGLSVVSDGGESILMNDDDSE